MILLAVVLGFVVKANDVVRSVEAGVAPIVGSARSAFADVIAVGLDRLDTVPVIAVIMTAVFVAVGLARSWLDGAAIVIVTGVAWASSLIVKLAVAQPRPPQDLRHGLPVGSATLSYPSGHVAFAVVLTVVLTSALWRTPARLAIIAVGVITIAVVAWSRLYLGLHYPTDLLGSVLLGIGAALVLCGAANALTRSTADRGGIRPSRGPASPRRSADAHAMIVRRRR